MAYTYEPCPLRCFYRKNYEDFDFESEEFEDIILFNCPGCKENIGAKFKQGSKAGNEYIKRMKESYGLD